MKIICCTAYDSHMWYVWMLKIHFIWTITYIELKENVSEKNVFCNVKWKLTIITLNSVTTFYIYGDFNILQFWNTKKCASFFVCFMYWAMNRIRIISFLFIACKFGEETYPHKARWHPKLSDNEEVACVKCRCKVSL